MFTIVHIQTTSVTMMALMILGLFLPNLVHGTVIDNQTSVLDSEGFIELITTCFENLSSPTCNAEALDDFFNSLQLEAQRRRNATEQTRLHEAIQARKVADQQFQNEVEGWANRTFTWFPGNVGSVYWFLRSSVIVMGIIFAMLCGFILLFTIAASERNMIVSVILLIGLPLMICFVYVLCEFTQMAVNRFVG